MRAAVKLGLGYGFLLLLMVVILLVGIIDMATMNQSAKRMFKDRYPKTVLVNDSIARTFDNGRSVRNLLLVDKDEVIEKNKTTIKENRAAIRQSLDKLDKLINTPKGRELMTVIRKLRDELDPKYEELVALARSDRAKAIEFLFKSMSWLSKLLWSGEQRPAGCDNAVSIGSGLSESVGSTFRPLIRSRRAEQTSRVPLVWSSHFCHSILLVSW